MPGPSWVENRMTLKTCPVGGAASVRPERDLPPDDPAVSVEGFMYRPPGIEAPCSKLQGIFDRKECGLILNDIG
jgi:hypothetical protein